MPLIFSHDIWKNLKDHGKLPLFFLSEVPEELVDPVREIEENLLESFRFIKSLHSAHVRSIQNLGIEGKKDLSRILVQIKDPRIDSGILILMRDGKNPDSKIWDAIKPKNFQILSKDKK